MSDRARHVLSFLLLAIAAPGCSHATSDGRSGCAVDADCPAAFPYCRADLRCWSSPGSLDGAMPDGSIEPIDGGTEDVPALDGAMPDAPDAPSVDAPPPCLDELPDVGTGDFVIELAVSLDTIGTHAGPHALVSQRDVCNAGNFWSLSITHGGVLQLAMDDGGLHTVDVTGCIDVQDGVLHHILVQRVGGVVDAFVDGVSDLHADATVVTPLTMLPPITVGTDACVGSGVADFPIGGASVLELRCIRTVFTPQIGDETCR